MQLFDRLPQMVKTWFTVQTQEAYKVSTVKTSCKILNLNSDHEKRFPLFFSLNIISENIVKLNFLY